MRCKFSKAILTALILFVSCLLNFTQAGIIASSNFNSGLDGWSQVGSGGTVTHELTNGNPDGYVRFEDGVNGRPYILNTGFSGDWTSLDGVGTISFDFKFFNYYGNPQPYEIIINGSSGNNATWNMNFPVAPMSWTSISADIVESSWTVSNNGDWSTILANVQSLQIQMELSSSSNDISGIDNVIVNGITSVPEPSTFAIFALGMIGLASRRLKKKS
jgi:hypothetical protein